jgi:iron complex transport system substrate-binding protein
VFGLALLATLLVAACTGGGADTSPAAATGSIVPTTTGTPGVSPSGSGTAGQPSPTPLAYPLTLVDDEGTSLTLAGPPARIVSLTPATTETLFALGAGDRVVATTDFDDYPPQVKTLPHVASFSSVDVEKIVSLRPDLVLAGGNGFNPPDAIAKLRDLGVPVLVVYAKDVAGVLADISLVGTAAGEAAAADAMTSEMRARIDAIAAGVASLDHPRTFYELDATKEIYGPAQDSFVAEMVKLAGGDPITTGSPTVFSIPLEKLVAADPQVIVLGDANYGTTPKDVAGRPGWSGMTAVKTGAVRPVDDTVVTRPGPRLVEGLLALERAIHPEAPVPLPAASQSPSAAALSAAGGR